MDAQLEAGVDRALNPTTKPARRRGGRTATGGWLAVGCVLTTLTVGCGGDGPTSAGLVPENPDVPATPLVFPDEPFRAMRPTPAPAAAYEPPLPEVFTLANGVQVVLA